MPDFQPETPTRLICTCGHSERYDAFTAFTRAGGRLIQNQQTNRSVAVCPNCLERRPAKAGTFTWDHTETELCLSLGAFTDQTPVQPEQTTYDINQTDFSAVANPVYLAQQRFDPTCIQCGQRLTDDDLRTDGEAPELGWEYYECPDCENQMRPNTAEPLEDDS